MRFAIAIPAPILRRADRAARQLHLSRSRLFTVALQRLLHEYEAETITAAINRVLAAQTSDLGPTLIELQARSIEPNSWA